MCVRKFSSNPLGVNSRMRGCVRTVLIGCVNYATDVRITVRNYAVNHPLCPLLFHDYLAFLVQFLPPLPSQSSLTVFHSFCTIYFYFPLSLSLCIFFLTHVPLPFRFSDLFFAIGVFSFFFFLFFLNPFRGSLRGASLCEKRVPHSLFIYFIFFCHNLSSPPY